MHAVFSIEDLIETCEARKRSYELISSQIHDPVLSVVFSKFIVQCRIFKEELLLSSPEMEEGDVSSTFITEIFNVYSDISLIRCRNPLMACISACEKIERASIEFYKSVLEDEFQHYIRLIANQQLEELKLAFESLVLIKRLLIAKQAIKNSGKKANNYK